jgi:hypothetical protein
MIQKILIKRLWYLGLLTSILFFSLGATVISAGFTLQGDRVQPIAGSAALGNTELSSVVFRHQEDLQGLRQELSKTRQELRDVRQELSEFRNEFSQFKNLYFRRF